MGKKQHRPYTILYFSSFGSLKGGGQRSLLYLVRGMDKALFRPVVVCPEKGDLITRLNGLGIETLVVPRTRLRQISIGFVMQLTRLFRKMHVALVDTDAPTETLYAGIAAKIVGIPLVWHIRVSNASFLDRLLCQLSTKLVLVAKSLESRFPYLDSTKLAPVINGISIEEYDAVPAVNIRKELGIDSGTLLVGCIGRIEEMKGQKYLVKAVELLSGITANIHVLLIGEADGTYLEDIRKMVKTAGSADSFSFLGHRTDAAGIIKNLDLVVSASAFGEGLSRVILEAMAAGKPVIATDIGGAKEAVVHGQTGYVIPARDHRALADVMNLVAASPEKRAHMGAAGRKRVEQNFSLSENIRKTEQIYLEILNDKN